MNETNDYSFLPIRNPSLHRYYSLQRDSFWTAAKIDMSKDANDLFKLTENEKHLLEMLVSFFSQLDGVVGDVLTESLVSKSSHLKEAKFFYAVQGAIEVIHNETYSLMNTVLVPDPVRREYLMDSIRHFPEIAAIAEWTAKPRNALETVVSMAFVEGVLFSSAFCCLYWFKKRSLFPGLTTANEYIARDEALHCDFGCELYYTLTQESEPLEREKIVEIFKEGIELSQNFTSLLCSKEVSGFTKDELDNYTLCCANTLSKKLGIGELFKTRPTYEWMILLALSGKSNFFEKTETNYTRPKSSGVSSLDLDVEF